MSEELFPEPFYRFHPLAFIDRHLFLTWAFLSILKTLHSIATARYTVSSSLWKHPQAEHSRCPFHRPLSQLWAILWFFWSKTHSLLEQPDQAISRICRDSSQVSVGSEVFVFGRWLNRCSPHSRIAFKITRTSCSADELFQCQWACQVQTCKAL